MLIGTIAALVLSQQPFVEGPRSGPMAGEVIGKVDADRCFQTVEKLCSFGTRHTLSPSDDPKRGAAAAREWLRKEFELAGKGTLSGMTVTLEEFAVPRMQRLPDGAKVVNVVAVLPGTMKEAEGRRYYVVGHLDTINGDRMDGKGDAPGANDDASGVAVVLECARALAGQRLDATIVFLCTGGEEQGLVGARFHAKAAAERGERVMGVLNNDIVGDPSPRVWTSHVNSQQRSRQRDLERAEPRFPFVRVFSEGVPKNASAAEFERYRLEGAESDSPSRQLARFVPEVAQRESTRIRPIKVFRQDRFLRGGDHAAFNESGFAAVRFTVPGEDYTRQHVDVTEKDGKPYGDLPSFVDGRYVGAVAELNAATLMHLANAPSPPPRARIVAKELSTDTLLRWDASPEPDVAGYEVLIRDTTEADWREVVHVGNVTEIRTPVSKDNVFFAVRAYDRDGWVSPAAFCWAERAAPAGEGTGGTERRESQPQK
ncbi:MAG TPA: M28 family metallopeptidase [Phycisphaerales bacterium]|nr:M28 family metallopeptidase [Phycisphaerales bacterium]